MIVISDTTPIISLMKTGRLELLQKLFDVVYIPKAVYQELTENEAFPEEIRFATAALISFLQLKKAPLITEFLSQPHSSSILLRFRLYGGGKTSSGRSLLSSRKSRGSFA